MQFEELMDRFMGAWNRHDAHAFAAVFAEDADFTNWRGVGASGRSKIEEFHAPVFATIFKNSHQEYDDIKTRFIRDDIAAVDVHWKMTECNRPPGKSAARSAGIVEFRDGERCGTMADQRDAQSGFIGSAAACEMTCWSHFVKDISAGFTEN